MGSSGEGADLPRLGQMVRDARRSQGVTLEELARRSGVSKSVVSQVERGATNPTLSTLWNISTALSLDPVELIGGQQRQEPSGSSPIQTLDVPVIENKRAGHRLFILNRPELAGRTEVYRLELRRGGKLESSPHDAGTVEQVTVLQGTVAIESGQSASTIYSGDTARYAADVTHAIREADGGLAEVILLVEFS